MPINAGWKAGRVPFESFFGPAMDLSPTASRFDNSISWLAAIGNEAALSVFDDFGADAIYARNRELADDAPSRARRGRLDARRPARGQSQHASCRCRSATADPAPLLAELKRRGVIGVGSRRQPAPGGPLLQPRGRHRRGSRARSPSSIRAHRAERDGSPLFPPIAASAVREHRGARRRLPRSGRSATRRSRHGRSRGAPRDATRPGGRSGRRRPAWPRSISGANCVVTGRCRRCSSFAESRPVLIASSAWNWPSSFQVARSTRSSASSGSPRVGSASRVACGDLGDGVLHDGVEQRLAGREVDVDRRPYDTRAASDLGHAGIGIARQRLERRCRGSPGRCGLRPSGGASASLRVSSASPSQ